MAAEEYLKAKKSGDRARRRAFFEKKSPYLPALDELVPDWNRLKKEAVGVFEIPLQLVTGTVTRARREAFAGNYMPILPADTEFASKWLQVLSHQTEEGIREPVSVYEYMGRFYTAEGNKRVSVLRFLGQPSVTADIVRVFPEEKDTEEQRLYREFLDFFRCTGTYDIMFREKGGYENLAGELGRNLREVWPQEAVRDLKSAFYNFCAALGDGKGADPFPASGDAFLVYIRTFGAESLLNGTEAEIRRNLGRVPGETRAGTYPGRYAVQIAVCFVLSAVLLRTLMHLLPEQ